MDKMKDPQKLFESKIDEDSNNSVVDGVNILARVVGEAFTPDGISRNGRYYPRSLWEKVCNSPELHERLNNHQILGTIGHESPINDESFLEGKFSHIVTKMFINEDGKGIAEVLVLNTPAGRVLNTLLRANSKLYVSTRASGDIIPNQLHEGVPIVNPDTYVFEGIDFVLEPGFLNASPNLVESLVKDNTPSDLDKLSKLINNTSESSSKTSTLLDEASNSDESKPKYKGHNIMETNETLDPFKSLNETLTRKNAELQLALTESTKKNAEILAENKTLKEQMSLLNEEVNDVRELHKKLGIYEGLGEPEDIQAVFDLTTELKDKLSAAEQAQADREEELGSDDEVRSALEKAGELADKLADMEAELGSQEEIKQALSSAEEYISNKEEEEAELGSAEEVKEALQSARRIITEYRKLGTPREIKECLSLLNKNINESRANKMVAEAKALAEKYNAPAKTIYGFLKKGISESEIASLCAPAKTMQESIHSAIDSMFDKSRRGRNLMESFSNISK